MTTNMTPRVETQRYEFAHSHKPRGKGRWAFQGTSVVDRSNAVNEVFFTNGSYTEAKKAAQAFFRGQSSIVVLA